MGDLFSKLQEARQRIDEAKKKLNDVIVEASSENGAIKISANANKALTAVHIEESFLKEKDAAEVQETLLQTVNQALEEAARKGELEMKNITRDILPNFPGLV